MRDVGPEPLEGVELTLLRMEDMTHEISEIEEHPTGRRDSLSTERLAAVRMERRFDGLHDRTELTLVGDRDDEEQVGDDKDIGDLQQHGVCGTPLVGGCCSKDRQRDGFV